MTMQSMAQATGTALDHSTTISWTVTVDSWLSPTVAPVLIAVILLAAIGTTILFLAGLVGYRRRRTVKHGTIAVVLGLLVVRSIVGLGTVFGVVPMVVHHLVEHGIDVLIAGLVLSVLYTHGSSSSKADSISRSTARSGPESVPPAGSSSSSTDAPSTTPHSRADRNSGSRRNAESSARSTSGDRE